MNKITVNHQTNLEKKIAINQSKTIEFISEKENLNYQIVIEEKVDCNLVFIGKSTNINLQIIQKKESNAQVSLFLENCNCNVKVILKESGAKVEYVQSSIGNTLLENSITIYHRDSNTVSKTYCNGFSLNQSKIIFDVNGYVEENSKNCSCLQDSKIIESTNSFSEINPNLYIENYEVEATHSAYIGPFKSQDLFYLESRGMKKKTAIQLLVKSLLLGKLHMEEARKSELILEIEKMLNTK